MTVPQISVFLPDKPGILAKFIKILMDNKIFIKAMTVAETENYGMLLLLVDKPMKCVELLESLKYLYSTTDVIAIKLTNMELYEVPKLLGDYQINIEYLYSTLLKDEAAIVIKVSVEDHFKAIDLLKENHFILLEQ